MENNPRQDKINSLKTLLNKGKEDFKSQIISKAPARAFILQDGNSYKEIFGEKKTFAEVEFKKLPCRMKFIIQPASKKQDHGKQPSN